MLQPLAGLDRVLAAALGDPRARLVFPSGLAAEFWTREALRLAAASDGDRPKLGVAARAAVQALPQDKFLSWDAFKALTCVSRVEGRKAASARLRSLFAADLLSRNAVSPFLTALIPPAHASSWEGFSAIVARSLPRLDALRRAALASGRGPADSPELADWLAIRERWAAFMDEHGRFEPSWEGRRWESEGSTWTILFPELLEDWAEYEELLPKDGSVRALGMSELCKEDEAPPPLLIRVFEGVLEEVRWALSAAAEAWDKDPSPDSVLISVAGLDGLAPWIEREAEGLGLPLDLRMGSPLSEWPAGRFFSLAASAASGGWAFAPVRDILLSACLPWKERARCAELVRFGLSHGVMEGWTEGGRPRDPWEFAFYDNLKTGLGAFYRELKKALRSMVEAAGFPQIRAAWMAFKRDFLDQDGFDPEADLVFARCVAVLDELVAAQAMAGFASVPSAFKLFLDALAAERYVPRGGKGGIRVLDWRVGAGLRPGLHLLLNAGQKAASVRTGGLSFLREDLCASLGLGESDASEDFIRAYASSGRRVLFSCSRAALEGAQVPHGAFRSLGAEGLDGEEGFRRERADPLDGELRAWRGLGAFPPRLPSALLRGLQAARETCLAERGTDYAKGEPPSPAALRAMARLGRPLSVSLLEDWLLCPWKALFGTILWVREDPEGLEAFDPNFRGIFLHRALAGLYRRVADLGPLAASRLDECRAFIPAALDAAERETVAESGRFASFVLAAERPLAAAAMEALLEEDAALFEGALISGLEEPLSLGPDEGPWPFKGRIDRLMKVNGKEWVVDYKSGPSPVEKDMALPAEGEEPSLSELQLSGYLAVLEILGRGGGAGLYWSAKDGSYHWLSGRPEAALDDAGLAEAKRRFLSLMDGMSAALGSGPFPLANWDARKKACPPCPLKGACRVRYGMD